MAIENTVKVRIGSLFITVANRLEFLAIESARYHVRGELDLRQTTYCVCKCLGGKYYDAPL